MQKYYICSYTEVYEGRETTLKVLSQSNNEVDIINMIYETDDDYIEDSELPEFNSYSKSWYIHLCDVFVSNIKFKKITENHYNILKLYI